ncbi:hypothetical protein F7725_025586 [Dissostichus mawsoni]|uniref:Integrase core domain-containing protein n=1 Tax=Dissostichus mawsoni TaxID=36200 RepID=A0A7J5XBJ1_DISMA|nr:hypothetical protein F7725_025586 [Dissostichus mawsoni]
MDHFDLISFYFHLGMNYNDILQSLAVKHSVIISKRHLIRLLKMHGLKRKQYADIGQVVDFIKQELEGPGRLHGYRWMHAKCLQSGINAKKEDVRLILANLDPNFSAMRRARRLIRRRYFAQGPNYIWHPSGIFINGCIGGFSRKIIWLKAAYTSSDPHVIGGYFVEAVEQTGGCPRIIRTNLGSENVVVRDIQTFLRRHDNDNRSGDRSYIAGTSTSNQRIESWWGILRKEGMEYWIQFLGEMKDEGLFVGDFLDKSLVQLSFRNVIQEHLDKIKAVWNTHRIRPTKNCNVPSGIPDVMYTVPQLWGSEDCVVPHSDLGACKQACKFLSTIPCDEDVFDLCNMIMLESGLTFPTNIPQAPSSLTELPEQFANITA